MYLSSQPPRRLLVPIGLAIVLASEIGGVALARGGVGGLVGPTQPARHSPAAAHAGSTAGLVVGRAARDAASRAGSPTRSERRAGGSPALAAGGTAAAHVRPAPNRGMVARPEIVASSKTSIVAPAPARHPATRASTPRTSATAITRSTPTAAAHVGRNHVWIPSLGVSRSVAFFPCTRKEPPANLVYRWGCGGHNNVYLMGHAYGVFKALHDAYYNRRLRKGMVVDYADGSGRVHRYSVVWWRVTAPTTAASWAWASLSRPSMTLQTCVGATGQDRLMVRLVQTR
jgi:hypothetical protein